MKNVLKTDDVLIAFCDSLRNQLINNGVDLEKNKAAFAYFLASTVAPLHDSSGLMLLFCNSPKEKKFLDGSIKVLSAGVNFSSVLLRPPWCKLRRRNC